MLNNILKSLNNVSTYSSSGSNAGAWIFMIIFFGIIIALIIVAIIGSRKDAREKLIENSKRKKIKIEADNNRIMVFGYLNNLITSLEKEIKNFKPSVGLKSLGDINKEYSEKIKILSSSKEIKSIFSMIDYKNEINPIITELSKHKPSTWNKDALFSTNLVKEKFKAFKKDEKNKEILKKGINYKWK